MPTENTTLIFGATGGVGSALAKRLSSKGVRVFLAGRDESKLSALASELNAPYGVCDAMDAESIDQVFAAAVEEFETLTSVVNCMGSVLLKPAHLTTQEEFERTIGVNLYSSFSIIRNAATKMRKHGGSVVLIGSAAAEIGMPNHEAIAAAKAGLIGLAKSAAASYAPRGIRVNVVNPGLVQTTMTQAIWGNEAQAEASRAMHAIGRLGEPEDIASCIEWLASPENSWVTGQTIGVDGGLASLLPRRKG